MNTKREHKKTLKFLKQVTGESHSIANLLCTIRECDEESQTVFAERLGVTRQRLCDIEHGRSRVSPKLAASFATKLGYSEAQFVRLALQDILDRDNLHYQVDISDVATYAN